MSDEYHMNLLSSWDEDLFALERNFPEEYAPYRMAIRIASLQLDLDAIRDASATWKEDHATMENLRARFPWIADYDDGDPFPTEFRIISARIAALEATVARLTAPVTEDELRRLDEDWAGAKDDTIEAYRGALTAFLERRMKG